MIKSSREILNDSEIVQNVNNPLLGNIRARFSKWAYEQMLYQHMMSHSLIAKLKDSKVPMQIYRLTENRTIFTVKDLESKDKSTVIITKENEVDSEDG